MTNNLNKYMRRLKITKQITNRDTRSLEKYFQEISKIELITPDEEAELAKRIREGDQIALNKLVNANLRFVVSAAKQYQGYGIGERNPLSLSPIGELFDITRQRVRQIRAKALRILQNKSRNQILKAYL